MEAILAPQHIIHGAVAEEEQCCIRPWSLDVRGKLGLGNAAGWRVGASSSTHFHLQHSPHWASPVRAHAKATTACRLGHCMHIFCQQAAAAAIRTQAYDGVGHGGSERVQDLALAS